MQNKASFTFVLIIAVLSLVKLWLAMALPVTALGFAHDDLLFLRLADSFLDWATLFHGNWLGTFDYLTLSKGPMYPLWVAFCFVLGVPLLLGQQLLYMLAGVTLLLALRKLNVKPFFLVLLYVCYLFGSAITVRVVGEGIYPALSVFILAGLIGMYAHHQGRLLKLGLWSLLSGLMLSAFWLTREESVWIMGLVAILLAYTLLCLYRTFRLSSELFKRTLLCVLPLLVLLVVLNAVALMNWLQYGTYTTVEFKSGSFLSAVGALERVKHPHWQRYLPVPGDVRQSIYEVTPAFQELQPFLEGDPGKEWERSSCRALKQTCGDIGGKWFIGAFREAVSLAGHYTDGAAADRYYRSLAEEINAACEDGRLDCLPERSTMVPPQRSEYIIPVIKSFFQGVQLLLNLSSGAVAVPATSEGSEEQLALFRELTREKLAPTSASLKKVPKQLFIKGWAFSTTDQLIQFAVRTKDGKDADFSLKHFPSADVDKHFGEKYVTAKNARFSIVTPCMTGCELRLYDNSGLLAVINLDDFKRDRNVLSKDVRFFMDSVAPISVDRLPMQSLLNGIKIKILQRIEHYKLKLKPILLFIFALYVAGLIGSIITRRFSFLLIVNTAILAAIVGRLFILALIDASCFPAVKPLYLSPLYPFLMIFSVLAVADFVQYRAVAAILGKVKAKIISQKSSGSAGSE